MILCACGQKTGAEGAGNANNAGAILENAAGAGADTGVGAGQNAAGAGTGNEDGADEGTDDPAAKVAEQLKLAWNFLTEGNYKEAVLAFTAVIDIDPKNGEAYKGRADSYVALADAAGSAGSGGAAASPGAEEAASQYIYYLNLAAQDYTKAAEYGYDKEQVKAGRKQIRQMLDDRGDSVRESGDTEQANAFSRQLMKLAESEDESIRSIALSRLEGMLVGYRTNKCGITASTVEAIDRPLYEFIVSHEDLQDSKSGARLLYYSSVALGEFGTAARGYEKMAEQEAFPAKYQVGAGGYTDIGAWNAGGEPSEDYGEYDIYGRELVHHSPADHPANVYTSYREYEGSSLRLISSHRTNTEGTVVTDVTYSYEDGRLASIQGRTTSGSNVSSFTITYSYAGREVTIVTEESDGDSRTLTSDVDYDGFVNMYFY